MTDQQDRERLDAIQQQGICTCKPVTAAGVMVTDKHCAMHGTPRFTFNGEPLGSPRHDPTT